MRTQDIVVVSIHADDARPAALDLKDIMLALKPHWANWRWNIRGLDWLGEEAEAFCQVVDGAGASGYWINSEKLFGRAQRIYQTIEGEFLAFPSHTDPESVLKEELALTEFPASRAELAIVAVDGNLFDIYAKEATLVTPLRESMCVHDEDPANYF